MGLQSLTLKLESYKGKRKLNYIKMSNLRTSNGDKSNIQTR